MPTYHQINRRGSRNTNFTAKTLDKIHSSLPWEIDKQAAVKIKSHLSYRILDTLFKLQECDLSLGLSSRRLLAKASGNDIYLDRSKPMNILPNREILYVLYDKGFIGKQFSLFNHQWLYFLTLKGSETVVKIEGAAR